MASEMVHHVAFGAEALAALLGAVEGPVVVVHPHMDGQIVSIVEALLTIGHRADEIGPRLVVCKVSLKVLAGSKFLRAGAECALEALLDFDNLAILASEALTSGSLALESGALELRVLVDPA